LDLSEPVEWKELDDKTPEDAGGSNANAHKDFVDRQRCNLEKRCDSWDLNEDNLDNHRDN